MRYHQGNPVSTLNMLSGECPSSPYARYVIRHPILQSRRVLRARQLMKILLDAPLLSLTRLHVTALMSQVHTVDGMVDYIELVGGYVYWRGLQSSH